MDDLKRYKKINEVIAKIHIRKTQDHKDVNFPQTNIQIQYNYKETLKEFFMQVDKLIEEQVKNSQNIPQKESQSGRLPYKMSRLA